MYNIYKLVPDGDHFNNPEYVCSYYSLEKAKEYIYDLFRNCVLKAVKRANSNFKEAKIDGTKIININNGSVKCGYYPWKIRPMPNELDYPNELIDEKFITVGGKEILLNLGYYETFGDVHPSFLIQKIEFVDLLNSTNSINSTESDYSNK